MAHALAAHTVSTPTADARLGPSRIGRSAAEILLCGIVVALRTLAARPQATWVAQADAAFVRTVALVTLRAVGLGSSLALAVTLEGDGDGERVLEAYRLNDEGFLLLFGATTSSGLHTERDLGEGRGMGQVSILLVADAKQYKPCFTGSLCSCIGHIISICRLHMYSVVSNCSFSIPSKFGKCPKVGSYYIWRDDHIWENKRRLGRVRDRNVCRPRNVTWSENTLRQRASEAVIKKTCKEGHKALEDNAF